MFILSSVGDFHAGLHSTITITFMARAMYEAANVRGKRAERQLMVSNGHVKSLAVVGRLEERRHTMPLSALESGLCVTGVPQDQQRRMRKLTILVAVLHFARNPPEPKAENLARSYLWVILARVLAFAYVVVLGGRITLHR